MNCPYCTEPTRVISTRTQETGNIYRRRVCPEGHRVTTLETPLGKDLREIIPLGLVAGYKQLMKAPV